MAYDVQTPLFDGPFDLLLHLILSEQVDLYELSLSAIVDAYLGELERMGALDLDVATEFLLIAATLVELKSRRLLPDEADVDLDDELSLWEERDLLLSRLLECKTFKDAAHMLERLHARAALSAPRVAGPEEHFLGLAPDLLAGVTPGELRNAFVKAVTPTPRLSVDLSHVTRVTITVMEAVQELVEELPGTGRITFERLTSGLVDRVDVVVRFLALLELFKQGLVDLDQPASFATITIRWIGEGSAHADLAALDTYDG